MWTVLPEHVSADRWPGASASSTPGWPWSFRLAGPRSAWPALEVYEFGDLLDVVSSTRMAVRLLRGCRTVTGETGSRAIAWGRLPAPGARLEVEFSRRRGGWRGRAGSPTVRPGVTEITGWCWVAIADGRFDHVCVRSGSASVRCRLNRGR
jgi:hypothetical protein